MINESRPKLKIPKTILETVLDIVGIILFLLSAGYILINWSIIPETVPSHFNAAGEPDGWGSKMSVWVLIVIGLIMWILLTIVEKFPHIYNYLSLTEENAERQYKNARLMLNLIKNEMILFFAYISWISTEVAIGVREGLGLWMLPIFIITLTGTIVFFIMRSIKFK